MAALIESGQVSFTYKSFVLDQHRPYAQWAAEAAYCAADQGKFRPYHEYLSANQKQFTKADLKSYAQRLELDTAAFNQCFDSGKFTKQVNAETNEAMKLGLPGTPSFIIDGKVLDWNSLDDVVKAVKAAAAK